MQAVMRGLGMLRLFGQKLGPYLILEILLPGGTLLALLLFLYQRRKLDIRTLVRSEGAGSKQAAPSWLGSAG